MPHEEVSKTGPHLKPESVSSSKDTSKDPQPPGSPEGAAGQAAQGVQSQQLLIAQATLTVPTVPIKAELSITK